jgi:transposase
MAASFAALDRPRSNRVNGNAAEVQLIREGIPAQYVKAFRKGQKNDYRDAEAIAEAVQRPTLRFVPIKRAEQLDLQALHRIRSRLVGHRTAVINQLRKIIW